MSRIQPNLAMAAGEVGPHSADVLGGEAGMPDRTELLEAALDSLPEGIALLNAEGRIVFWNQAAHAVTGYAGMDLLARPAPEALTPLLLAGTRPGEQDPCAGTHGGCGALVHLKHKQGHDVAALRDGLGVRIGTAAIFHPTESLDALPHGECGEDAGVKATQAEIEDRLQAVFGDFQLGGPPFGVLWITVDQAHELRRTHGIGACAAMLEKVERALANGLRPAESLGRWGDDEFLAISHERTPELLADHARTLAGLARTAEFQWWGDRISLTVSIGAAQAEPAEATAQLLERAKAAMFSSLEAGGNRITTAPGGQSCLPS